MDVLIYYIYRRWLYTFVTHNIPRINTCNSPGSLYHNKIDYIRTQNIFAMVYLCRLLVGI